MTFRALPVSSFTIFLTFIWKLFLFVGRIGSPKIKTKQENQFSPFLLLAFLFRIVLHLLKAPSIYKSRMNNGEPNRGSAELERKVLYAKLFPSFFMQFCASLLFFPPGFLGRTSVFVFHYWFFSIFCLFTFLYQSCNFFFEITTKAEFPFLRSWSVFLPVFFLAAIDSRWKEEKIIRKELFFGPVIQGK